MSEQKLTRLVISAKKPKPDLIIEVDWDKRQKQTYLHAEMGGVKSKLKATDFWRAAFVTAPTGKQADMLPMRDKETHFVYKTLKIQAKEDIKAGEFITVHAKLAIPQEVVDDITGVKKLEKAIPTYDRLTVSEKQTPNYGESIEDGKG